MCYARDIGLAEMADGRGHALDRAVETMTAERPHTRRSDNSGGTDSRSGQLEPQDVEDPDSDWMYSGTGLATVTCPYFEAGQTDRVPTQLILHEQWGGRVSLGIRSGPEVDEDDELHISHTIDLTPADAAALGEQLIQWAELARERSGQEARSDD